MLRWLVFVTCWHCRTLCCAAAADLTTLKSWYEAELGSVHERQRMVLKSLDEALRFSTIGAGSMGYNTTRPSILWLDEEVDREILGLFAAVRARLLLLAGRDPSSAARRNTSLQQPPLVPAPHWQPLALNAYAPRRPHIPAPPPTSPPPPHACELKLDAWCAENCPAFASLGGGVVPLVARKWTRTGFVKNGWRVNFWGCFPLGLNATIEDEESGLVRHFSQARCCRPAFCGEHSIKSPTKWKTGEQRELGHIHMRDRVCAERRGGFDEGPRGESKRFRNRTSSLRTRGRWKRDRSEPVPVPFPTNGSDGVPPVLIAIGMYGRDCDEVRRFQRFCIGCERGEYLELVAMVDEPLANCSTNLTGHVTVRRTDDLLHSAIGIVTTSSSDAPPPTVGATSNTATRQRATFNFYRTRALFTLLLQVCPKAFWFMKTDTDSLINVPALRVTLSSLPPHTDYIGKSMSLFRYRPGVEIRSPIPGRLSPAGPIAALASAFGHRLSIRSGNSGMRRGVREVAAGRHFEYMQGGAYVLSRRAAATMKHCPRFGWAACPNRYFVAWDASEDEKLPASQLPCFSNSTMNVRMRRKT